MKTRIANYLKVLGILQLIGLNLAGIFWLEWASGIRRGKQSSRRWVICIHSLYLVACAWLLFKVCFGSAEPSRLHVFGRHMEVGRPTALAFILAMALVYGLPIVWLMSPSVKREFGEPCAPPNGGPAASADSPNAPDGSPSVR